MSLITCVIFFVFFGLALVFDGINLSGELYSNDIFLYLVLLGVVEVPAILLCAPAINRFGRKLPLVASCFVCGLVVLGLTFVPAGESSQWEVGNLPVNWAFRS